MTGSDRPVEPLEAEDTHDLGIRELCRLCGLEEERLAEWVGEGLVRPSGERVTEWRFSARQVSRVRRARRLETDLGLDGASLPLVLDLLDELQRLRRRLAILERRYFEDD